MNENTKPKKKSVVRKSIKRVIKFRRARRIRKNIGLILVVIILAIVILLVTLIASIVASGGGFLLLYRPESLSKDTSELQADFALRSGGGTTGMPQLLPGERFYFPVDRNTVSSVFGKRKSPTPGGSVDHKALDIGAGGSTVPITIYPGRPGVVTEVIRFNPPPAQVYSKGGSALGQYVKIEHDVSGKKMYSLYGHMYRIHVEKGDVVNMDTPLGIMGNTGASSGTHLHFEIRNSKGDPIDPALVTYCGGIDIKYGTKASDCFQYRGVID